MVCFSHSGAAAAHWCAQKIFKFNAAQLECEMLESLRAIVRYYEARFTRNDDLGHRAFWSCIAMENAALQSGARDARACARALEGLRERSVPTSAPIRFHRQLPGLG